MTIEWTVEQDIGHVTLSVPPSNTMTMAFFTEMKALIPEITHLQNLKGIIITGKGRHFSSGADISELLLNADETIMLDNYRVLSLLEQMEIPVVSAIRGVCLGSAFELTLFSHFRLCSEDAVIGLPESTFNLMPGLGGTQRVAALTGKARAIEIILRGQTFPAADALEMGLVDAVVPKNEVLPFAVSFIQSLPDGFRKADRNVLLYKYLKPFNVNG
jgi:enoyl-CoA hydratase